MTRRHLVWGTTVAGGVLVAGLALGATRDWGGHHFENVLHDSAEVVVAMVAAIACWFGAGRSRGRRVWAWRLWGGFALASGVGEALLVGNDLIGAATVFPSPADILFLSAEVMAMAGAICFLPRGDHRGDLVVLALDGVLIGIAVLLASWDTWLETAMGGSSEGTPAQLFSLAYPFSDAIVLTVLLTVMTRMRSHPRAPLALIGAGMLFTLAGDSALAYQAAIGQYNVGSVLEVAWTAGLVCILLGAIVGSTQDARRASGEVATVTTHMWYVPIIAAATACFLTLKEYLESPSLDAMFVGCTVTLVLLGAVRQMLSVRLNLRLTRELEHHVLHDDLTGLGNRMLLRNRLEHLATTAPVPTTVALLILDLDGFKDINDCFGHAAGDLVLGAVAERIQAEVRASDTVARLGGDEFAVLLEGIDGQEDAVGVTERILTALRAPFAIGDATMVINGSVGLALSTGVVDEALLRQADLAMYWAKATGRGLMRIYEPEMYAAVSERVRIESELRDALAGGELRLHYQPVVELATGRMVGVEALLRWQHPHRGLLGPDSFIPVAESSGLILPIGAWVVEEACRQVANWRARFPAAARLTVNVNVSGRQLLDPGDSLLNAVSRALLVSRLRPEDLALEVTETAFMDDVDGAIAVLTRLKRLGIRVCLDDFGMGSSSLARLRTLPIDVLKIDKSFVDHVPDGPLSTALADAISGVARALRLTAVVEGVERGDQASYLRSSGYELAQGYYFSRPMSAERIAAALAESGLAIHGDALPAREVHQPDPVSRVPSGIVLIVEDNQPLAEAASRFLEYRGMHPVVADSCRAAFEHLDRAPVDAVIVDLRLPDGDGWDLISRLRSRARYADVPIVVMTGVLDTADVLRRAESLRCEYLGKPFVGEALGAKITRARRLVASAHSDMPSMVSSPAG